MQEEIRSSINQGARISEPVRMPRHDSDDRGSLVSLTEEQEELEDTGRPLDLVSRNTNPTPYTFSQQNAGPRIY